MIEVRREILVGIKLCLDLSERWSLDKEQSLRIMGLTREELAHVLNNRVSEKKMDLDLEALEYRLSLIAGIRASVEGLFPQKRWDSYMHSPNQEFDGSSPIEVILRDGEAGLRNIHSYLLSARGSHYL